MKDRAEEIENLKERVDDIDRRQFLKAAGIAGGTAGALGIVWYGTRDDEPTEVPPDDDDPPDPPEIPPDDDEPPEEQPPEEPPEVDEVPFIDEFETVIDVTEEGADPEGREPINHLFQEFADDRTLFMFEPGTYRFDPIELQSRTRVGLVTDGDEPATFIPNDEGCRGGHPYFNFNYVDGLVIDSIDLDFGQVDSGGPLFMFLEGESVIRNLSYLGSCSNQQGVVRVEVPDPNGTALIDNFVTHNTDENHTLTAVYVSDGHAGELTFQNCSIDNFSDNGIYASAPGGPNGNDGVVNVIGGTFRNNNISNIRLGSTGARAEDVTVIVDDQTPGWGQLNSRGIRLRNQEQQEIHNCDIRFGPEAADSFGAIVFHQANGGARVTDTSIQIDRDGIPAFKAFPPDDEPETSPVFENVTVSGDASGGPVAEIAGRPGTVFRDCIIEQPDPNRQGFLIEGSQGCHFEDCHIEIGQQPFALNSSTVTLENTRVITQQGERLIENETFENEPVEL